ncbi:MAG TPA: GNAT family N-acetyltransferase [Clostridiaceae bacterium]|nr:GNAT family N-acetyltransferase [Clostridiaceae bacterium]
MDERKILHDVEEEKLNLLTDTGEDLGYMTYYLNGNVLTVNHTKLKRKAKGMGLAQELLDAVAEYARAEGYRLNASCSYAKKMIERYPERYGDVRGPVIDVPEDPFQDYKPY